MLLSLYPKFCTGSEAPHFKKALPSEDQTEETLKQVLASYCWGQVQLRIFSTFLRDCKKREKKRGREEGKENYATETISSLQICGQT